MSLQTMLAGGAVAYVAWARAHGYDEARTKEGLRTKYPNDTGTAINAAYNRGIRGVDSGHTLEGKDEHVPLAASEVARGLPGQTRYRYSVLANVKDLQTGQTLQRPVTVFSNTSLSRAELSAEVAAIITRDYVGSGRRRDFSDPIGNFLLEPMEIYAVERSA